MLLARLMVSPSKSRLPGNSVDAGMTVQIDRSDLGQGSGAGSKRHFILVCIQGLEVGKPSELYLVETIVGRTPNAGLVLANSQISRQHAKLIWTDGGHVLEDLGSANGTFVGGVRITKQRLFPGDIIHFGTTFAFRYSVMDETEKSLMEQLYRTSVLDALTGAYNREYFNSVIETEVKQAQTTSTSLSLLLLDIDHFKHINDTYGHSAGDAVLIEVVSRLRARIASSAVLCRYGGEEFVIILRSTTLETAHKVAERLRSAVRKQRFTCGPASIPVTVSIGCSTTDGGGGPHTPTSLIEIADRRLYAAKGAGRDRVVFQD